MINEAKEREEFEAWLSVYDHHLKEYNTHGVQKSGTTMWCYTYANTAALFSAWCGAKRKADEDAEKWLPIEQFPDTPADVWFAFSDGAVEFYGYFMFSDNYVWYPNKPTHFMLAKIPPQPAAQEGDTP